MFLDFFEMYFVKFIVFDRYLVSAPLPPQRKVTSTDLPERRYHIQKQMLDTTQCHTLETVWTQQAFYDRSEQAILFWTRITYLRMLFLDMCWTWNTFGRKGAQG